MATLPSAFVQRMQELLGEQEAALLLKALDSPAPTSIRLSQSRTRGQATLPMGTGPIPWCPWGQYLEARPTFTGDAALHGGLYYVQEASSMLLYQVRSLLGDTPLHALDLCAAPGGKSTLLLDLLPRGSVLVSNEVMHHRANILMENIHKWGSPYSIVTSSTPQRLGLASSAFDLALVDAPCSGEGMFRKDRVAREEWSPSAPQMCAERQRSILDDLWPALRPGGILIYSTCTFDKAENEDVVAYIIDTLGASPISLDDLPSEVWRSPFAPFPCYRMMPHRAKGEGLFMAVLRKHGEGTTRSSKGRRTPPSARQAIPEQMRGWIVHPESYSWERGGDNVIAYPSTMLPLLSMLQDLRIPILSAGIPIGMIKGKSLIPHHALALSTELAPDAFDQVELTDEQLIPYLSREAIVLDPTYTQGIKLVCYQGIALGFAKHLGNRTNNLYPAEWRIRHGERLQRERLASPNG